MTGQMLERVYCDYRTEQGTSSVVVNRANLGHRREWNVHIALRRIVDGKEVLIQHPLAGTTVVCQTALRCRLFLEWLRLQHVDFVVPEQALVSLEAEQPMVTRH